MPGQGRKPICSFPPKHNRNRAFAGVRGWPGIQPNEQPDQTALLE